MTNCQVFREHKTTEGKVDIVIKDSSEQNIIVIENKIYAGEQHDQLLRYHKSFPKGKLLFLTLEGRKSDQKIFKRNKLYTYLL